MGERAIEEFAGAVGALKERSGLSYGALAKRLHMSTSTLHRYCSGAAVPVDYAPVERLARVCGATSAELVELHRLWVLADEARTRGREPAPGDRPGPPEHRGSPERPGPPDHPGPPERPGQPASTAMASPAASGHSSRRPRRRGPRRSVPAC